MYSNMCFSAEASFLSAGLLGLVGVRALYVVKHHAHIPFATIPLLFGVHQLSEGFLWLALSGQIGSWYISWFLYIFLFFSQIVRASRIPYTILFVETCAVQKKILRFLTVLWIIVSTYLLYCLLTFFVSAEIIDTHIYYFLDFPKEPKLYMSILYCIAIVVSPLVSSNSRIRLLWLLLAASLLFTKVFYAYHLISVWCFFAALLSVFVLGVVDQQRTKKVKNYVQHLFT